VLADENSGTIAQNYGLIVTDRAVGSSSRANIWITAHAYDTAVAGNWSIYNNSTYDNYFGGNLYLAAGSTSTTQLEVRDATSATVTLLVADSTNDRIYVGDTTADATGTLLVLDTKNTSGDPTGVGKTETASGLSDHLFGKDTLIRVDMGEYTEHHSVSRLIGSPPGYVGYATDTAFAAALKKTTRRVILFDEIEKAAPNIHELLLGMLDSGRLTLSTGELLDLRESVIIMTTNALADQAGKSKLGFQETEESRNLLSNYREALLKNKVFAPEFVNRMDLVLPFKVLDKAAASAIALREIEQIREELSYQGFTLSYTQEAFDKALKNSDASQGGRGIIRSIDSWKREIVSKIRKNTIVKENDKKIIVIEGSNVW
jgi:hypothetical protein